MDWEVLGYARRFKAEVVNYADNLGGAWQGAGGRYADGG